MFKGGLSGRMTWQFLNALDIFSSYKSNLSNFCFQSIFICNKKEPQSCQFVTYWRKALSEFLTSQIGEMTFIIFNVIIRTLRISLIHYPKAVHYFENTLPEMIFLSDYISLR